ASALVRTIYAHLPAGATRLRSTQRKARARLHAAYVFSKYREATVPLWRHTVVAMVNDPAWIKHVGLWSIAGESLLGQPMATYLRKRLRTEATTHQVQ